MDSLRRTPNPESGAAALPLLLIALLIIALEIASIFTSHFIAKQMHLRALHKSSMNLVKIEMQTQLANAEVWQKILELNPAMTCVKTAACPDVQTKPFVVYDVKGAAISGPNAPGYDSFGRPCETVNDACPVKYSFTWRPVCSTPATCLNPEVEIVGNLPSSSGFMGLLDNMSNYRIVIFRRLF